ncbi:MAG TPA: hypothetical protein VM600_07310 [Actinomycetota bacterium]|nr:hypothetical protein [Actinomycetota bacterium]
MSAELYAVFAAPVLGAALLLAIPRDVALRTHRFVTAAAVLAAMGGAARALVRAIASGPYASASFTVDEWRLGVVLAALLITGAAIARGPALAAGGIAALDDRAPADSVRDSALLLAATACAPLAALASSTPIFALACVLTTACLTALAWNGSARVTASLMWRFALSDIAIACGALLAASDGLLTPAEPRGVAAALLAAAALLRAGSIPRSGDPLATEGRPELGAVSLGVMRGQAFAIVGWLAVAQTDVRVWLAVAAAASAVWWARRAARDATPAAALFAHASLVVCGIAMASPASTAGAVLLAAGATVASAMFVLGRSGGRFAPTIGAAPLGATFAGAAAISAAAVARGIVDAPSLAIGVLATAATCYLALAGVGGFRLPQRDPASAIFGWLLLAFTAVFVVIPGLVTDAAAAQAARSLGAARALAPLEPPVGNDLGLAFAIAASAGMVASMPRRDVAPVPHGAGAAPSHEMTPREARIVISLLAASVAASSALLWVGTRRGFL